MRNFYIGQQLFKVISFGSQIITGVPPIVAIGADGWRATYPDPPADFDPVASPETFTVSRAGFDVTGAATTVSDTITLMKRVRDPYPDQADLTATDVALSDEIYSTDVITGVTNNSTEAAPKPVCLWMRPDMDRATGDSYTARLFVAHKHARNGKPVASVQFRISDGTTTVTANVTALSTITYAASGKTVPHYSATLDLSTLDDNVALTLDVIVYPWVGAAYQASVDGDANAVAYKQFGVMSVFNDVSYGTAYAYVDIGAGGGTVSTTPATAQADPYPTIAAAANAIKTYNNSNFSRNFSSGGIIRLETGVHTISGFSGATTDTLALIVEAADAADKATTVIQDAGSSTNNSTPKRMHFRNIVLRQNAAGNVIFLGTGAWHDNDYRMIFENVSFDRTTSGDFYQGWIYQVGRVWAIDCNCEGKPFSPFGVSNKQAMAIGCSGEPGSCDNLVGCNITNGYNPSPFSTTTQGLAPPNTIVLAYNTISETNTGGATIITKARTVSGGMAIVGNVFEDIDGTTSATVDLWGDGDTSAQSNLVMQTNTIVGQRLNLMYLDTGSTSVSKRASLRFNAMRTINTKSDTFPTANAARVGNWPVLYHVGWRSNAFLRGSEDGTSAPAIGSWLGEVFALGDVSGSGATPIDPDWTADASGDGTGLGGGDYRPGASSELPLIPAGLAPYPVDQNGTIIPNDGTARIGALQPA